MTEKYRHSGSNSPTAPKGGPNSPKGYGPSPNSPRYRGAPPATLRRPGSSGYGTMKSPSGESQDFASIRRNPNKHLNTTLTRKKTGNNNAARAAVEQFYRIRNL